MRLIAALLLSVVVLWCLANSQTPLAIITVVSLFCLHPPAALGLTLALLALFLVH